MKRIFNFIFSAGFLICSAAACNAALPTKEKPEIELLLNDQSAQVRIGNHLQPVDADLGKDKDGPVALFGSRFGIGIPAASLNEKQGTIFCRFKMSKPRKNFTDPRYFLTLRGANSLWIGFCFYPGTFKLYSTFTYIGQEHCIATRNELNPDTWYDAICTWDGAKVRFYLDGIPQGEQEQAVTVSFPESSRLYLGPFAVDTRAWQENDIMISKAAVYNKVLKFEDIVPAGNNNSAAGQSCLSIPKIKTPPQISGSFDDGKWANASSFVALRDGQQPNESLGYPPSQVFFSYDKDNLYLAFSSLFPPLAQIIKGNDKVDKNSDVWADESFEFYVHKEKDIYRFAGNVAGGSTESLNNSSAFRGPWVYKSSLRMQIDNCELWQGEIAIPFKTIGMAAPVDGKTLKVNFCRTWRCLDAEGLTSLAGTASYNDTAHFVTLKFSDKAAVFQELRHNNPNYGALKQEVKICAPATGDYSYGIYLNDSRGRVPPEKLVEKRFAALPHKNTLLSIDENISSSYFDSLQFVFKDLAGNRTLMQQTVPFRLSDDYLTVKPAFSYGKLWVFAKYSRLRNKIGERTPLVFTLRDATGKRIALATIKSDEPFQVNFDRDNRSGVYKAILSSAIDGKDVVHTAKEFYYPGRSDFDRPQFTAEKILPPFIPITVTGKKNDFSIAVWGRTYQWAGTLFPASITSHKQPLLSAPVELLIDGKSITDCRSNLTRFSPARCEISGQAASSKYHVGLNSWIEYDGLLWNDLKISARKDLPAIALQITMPEKTAPYLHVAKGGFGSDGSLTAAVGLSREISFAPVIWLGAQEQGLIWFAETAGTWRTKKDNPIRIVRENGNVVMTITLADALPRGAVMDLSFGLMATPIKPLPANYPLNIFADPFAAKHNQSRPHAPISETILILGDLDIGHGFFDLPLQSSEKKDLARLNRDTAEAHKNHTKAIPYMDPVMFPDEYPTATAYRDEWLRMPQGFLNYYADGKKHDMWWDCPASKGADYFIQQTKELLKKSDIDGMYFDFGPALKCNNPIHGCHDRYPILAMRNFYRGIAEAFVNAGKSDYRIVIHTSDTLQVPTLSFVTHNFNGEHFRQLSSNTYHDGKDILDRLTIDDWASEFSSLPFGVTCATYMATDPLIKEFGGGKEESELYIFRMTKAFLAGSLVHNTIPSSSRGHFGLFDKLVRIYDGFEVSKATFIPYWNNNGIFKTEKGNDIYVSAYQHHAGRELLLVVSHISKQHQDQEVVIAVDPSRLGWKKITAAEEMLTRDDPDYPRLLPETNRTRIPVKPGDFGVKFKGLDGNRLNLVLKYHSVALIRITGE